MPTIFVIHTVPEQRKRDGDEGHAENLSTQENFCGVQEVESKTLSAVTGEGRTAWGGRARMSRGHGYLQRRILDVLAVPPPDRNDGWWSVRRLEHEALIARGVWDDRVEAPAELRRYIKESQEQAQAFALMCDLAPYPEAERRSFRRALKRLCDEGLVSHGVFKGTGKQAPYYKLR